MFAAKLLHLLTQLFAGLLAGFEIAVHYGLGPSPKSLDERAQILLRQALVLRLRLLAPALFVPTLALGISSGVESRHSSNVWFYVVALALLCVWIGIRIVRTVPENSETLEWDPANPPTGWREQVEQTERFHVIAAWAAVGAFFCFLGVTLG